MTNRTATYYRVRTIIRVVVGTVALAAPLALYGVACALLSVTPS